MPTGANVVAVARSQLGIPFHHGQALQDVACDCIGLVLIVAEALGLPEAAAFKQDVRFRGYGRTPMPAPLFAACADYLDPIPVHSATLGDILLFYFVRDPQHDPMHFGILSRESPRYVVHAYERVGKVVENGADATFWRARAAFRLRGVT